MSFKISASQIFDDDDDDDGGGGLGAIVFERVVIRRHVHLTCLIKDSMKSILRVEHC